MRITRLEAIYLSDALSMHSQADPRTGAEANPYAHFPGLLLKIGGAVLETAVPMVNEAEAVLDERELWVVREVCKSSVQVGTEKVGMSLLLKVYQDLLSMAAMDTTGQIPETTDANEPPKSEVLQQLTEFQENQENESEHNADRAN